MSMTENDYRHFVCIVAGENPDKLMEEYNKKLDYDIKLCAKCRFTKSAFYVIILVCLVNKLMLGGYLIWKT